MKERNRAGIKAEKVEKEFKSEAVSEVKLQVKNEVKLEVKAEIKLDVKREFKAEVKSEIREEPMVSVKTKPKATMQFKKEVKNEEALQPHHRRTSKDEVKAENEVTKPLSEMGNTSAETKPLIKSEVKKIKVEGSELFDFEKSGILKNNIKIEDKKDVSGEEESPVSHHLGPTGDVNMPALKNDNISKTYQPKSAVLRLRRSSLQKSRIK